MYVLDAEELDSMDVGRVFHNPLGRELGGYVSDCGKFIGILILDLVDKNYSFVIQEKKTSGWENILAMVDYPTEQEARTHILIEMQKRGCQ